MVAELVLQHLHRHLLLPQYATIDLAKVALAKRFQELNVSQVDLGRVSSLDMQRQGHLAGYLATAIRKKGWRRNSYSGLQWGQGRLSHVRNVHIVAAHSTRGHRLLHRHRQVARKGARHGPVRVLQVGVSAQKRAVVL
jgi:hypothetical protein